MDKAPEIVARRQWLAVVNGAWYRALSKADCAAVESALRRLTPTAVSNLTAKVSAYEEAYSE